jgi:hypothetical protein
MAVIVNDPPPGTIVPVRAPVPMSYGYLCRCRGTVQPTGMYFDGLYFKVAYAGAVYTTNDVINAPDAILHSSAIYPGGYVPNVAANWNVDGILHAKCADALPFPDNTLYVVERCINFAGGAYQVQLTLTLSGFKGQRVDACP